MATWKEQREMLEALGSTRRHGWGMSLIQAERHAIAIQAALARLDAAERMVAELADQLRSSAPQSWAAGTSLYENACEWERQADALIKRADALVREQDGGR